MSVVRRRKDAVEALEHAMQGVQTYDPQRIVITRHAFRSALIPIITIIGLSLPELVGGAVIIETVFSWPGLGNMMVEAVQQRDTPMIMGLSLIVAVFVLMANLLTDVMYAVADPRVRYS